MSQILRIKDWGIGQVQSIIGNKVTVNFEKLWQKSNKHRKCNS